MPPVILFRSPAPVTLPVIVSVTLAAVSSVPFSLIVTVPPIVLVVPLVAQTYTVTDQKMGVNYGLNKVRFPAPVPVGSKVRARVTLKDVEEVAGGLQVTFAVTIEREGGDKPVCIAEPVYRYYGG